MLHVAVLVTTSSELGGPGMHLPMDALAEAKASIAVASSPASSDSEGEVAQPYHFCGQQVQEFHCSVPEHVSLDWLLDTATDDAAGDTAATIGENGQSLAAEAHCAVGQNGQPLAAEAQCVVTTAIIGQNAQPLAAEAQHAVTPAAIGQNGQPLAAEVQCAATAAAIGRNGQDWEEHGSLFKPGVLAYYIGSSGASDATVAHVEVQIQEKHMINGETYLTVTHVHEDGPPFTVAADSLMFRPRELLRTKEEGEEEIGYGTRTARGKGRGRPKKSDAKGQGAQAKAAAAPALGSAKSVATAQKHAKAASKVKVHKSKRGLEENAQMLLHYKTDKSAGSSAYRKHLRMHPGEFLQAREICRGAIHKYRSLLLGDAPTKGMRQALRIVGI